MARITQSLTSKALHAPGINRVYLANHEDIVSFGTDFNGALTGIYSDQGVTPLPFFEYRGSGVNAVPSVISVDGQAGINFRIEIECSIGPITDVGLAEIKRMLTARLVIATRDLGGLVVVHGLGAGLRAREISMLQANNNAVRFVLAGIERHSSRIANYDFVNTHG